jgi:hypothetical protein
MSRREAFEQGIRAHLQDSHGLDIEGEWHHAPDDYRQNMMSDEGLHTRHGELHDVEAWNEASERHEHG